MNDGSLLSTNLGDLVVPFGSVQASADWTYPLLQSQTLVYDGDLDLFPAATITLAGSDVRVNDGSTIDVSASGDLLAYEFISGIGGTDDFLDPDNTPGLYALLPGSNPGFAPIDPQIENEGANGLNIGDTVFLNGVGTVATGTYTLLPARYALLPGAVLVRQVDGFDDILPGEVFAGRQGSVIVAGQAGNRFGALDARTSGFELLPRQRAFAEASYTLSTATDFFADDPTVRTPADAGNVSFSAENVLTLSGNLVAGTAAGRGASVDIASSNLRIVDTLSGDDTAVELIAADLVNLGAESLLIGGQRSAGDEEESLTVVAQTVEVADGVGLTAPTLILAATNQLTVGAGARVASSAGTIQAQSLSTSGDAGILVASAGEVSLNRTDVIGAEGDITLAEGSVLAATGTAIIDASANVTLDGGVEAAGGRLQLGATDVSIGDVPADVTGLALTAELLGDLEAGTFIINSRNAIGVYGSTALTVDNGFQLQAPGLVAATDNAALDLTVGSLTLTGSAGPVAATSVFDNGRFNVTGQTLTLGAGNVVLDGFQTTDFTVTNGVTIDAPGALDTTGALTVSTQGVVIGADADYSLNAAGDLRLVGTPLAGAANGAGGRLVLGGENIEINTALTGEAALLSASAANNLTLGQNASINLAGLTRQFGNETLTTPGGLLQLTAGAGDLSVASTATIDVSGGRAGTVAFTAAAGVLDLGGALTAAGTGGAFLADARAFQNQGALFDAIIDAGFAGTIAVRQRGAGTLALSGDRDLTAEQISLINDGGGLLINGDLTTPGAGSVALYARDDITVASRLGRSPDNLADGSMLVRADSTSGTIDFTDASTLAVTDQDRVWLALERDVLLRNLDADATNNGLTLAGNLTGAPTIQVEGRAVYNDAVITSADTAATLANPLFADADAFMTNAGAIADAFGPLSVEVIPGVVIESAGDLTVADEFNLFDWRFDDAPGVLTLRAAGDLVFQDSLNDAFSNDLDGLLTYTGDSWSYQLVGGADLSSAALMATRLDRTAGDVIIEAGVLGTGGRRPTPPQPVVIRTGNGSIDLAAAGDVTFGNQASVLYTSGIATDGVLLTARGEVGNRLYPDQGGDISIVAGGDILGAESNQLVTDWLWRSGRATNTTRPVATAWTVNFANFQQNVGALGGGNVNVVAGGDIIDFSANIPSIGRQVGGTTPDESIVEIVGGGDLSVAAGGDVIGGSYYVGLGEGAITAEGEVGRAGADALATVLAIGDASLNVQGRGDVRISTIVNPTLLPQGNSQNAPQSARSFFSTYADDSGATLTSLTGNVVTADLSERTAEFTAQFDSLAATPGVENLIRLYAPRLTTIAYDGDVRLEGSFTLTPSAEGDLGVYAENDVLLGNTQGGFTLLQSDANPALVPTVANPLGQTVSSLGPLFSISGNVNFNAPTPRFAGTDGFNEIVARTGNVEMITASVADLGVLYSARPIRINAGNDVINLGLFAQNLDEGSVTSITAGNDIIFPNSRDVEGRLQVNRRELRVAGPGNLLLRAGGDIDLQTSAGITTSGNIENQALPESGASVSLLAGLAGQAPQYDAFITAYVVDSDEYAPELEAFVASVTGVTPADRAAALAAFDALDQEQQAVFVEEILFAELRASGREAAVPGEFFEDFTRGFDALTTLFPGANPDLEAGETNAYDGDVSLFFSRVYTLDGGDVRLIVPGGQVNAGLASPPSAFGVIKQPEELGIVAQSDGDINSVSFGNFEVNESRVFAADGGNILVWSTRGDIDAGRGAKTAISAPPPQITINPEDGSISFVFPAALTGSGIQTIATSEGRSPGDVDLFAPRGVVNAGDAGIVAGNLTVAAVAVLGADNIDVSGVSIGVPTTTAVAPGLASQANVAAGANQAAQDAVAPTSEDDESDTPLGDQALGFLDVFILGFGDCDPNTGQNCDEDAP